MAKQVSEWAKELGAKLLGMIDEDRTLTEFNKAIDSAAEEVAEACKTATIAAIDGAIHAADEIKNTGASKALQNLRSVIYAMDGKRVLDKLGSTHESSEVKR